MAVEFSRVGGGGIIKIVKHTDPIVMREIWDGDVAILDALPLENVMAWNRII